MPLGLPRLGRNQAAVTVITAGVLAGTLVAGLDPRSGAPHDHLSLAAGHPTTIAARPPIGAALPVAAGARTPRVDCRHARCVALTFDDGPDIYTDRLLGTLRAAHVRATFFMLGIQVQKFPAVARHVARAGQEIGDHTWDHQDLTQLSPEAARAEIARAKTEIADTIDMEPALFRPPYGSTDPAVAHLIGLLGMPVILWNVDTLDWRDRYADVVSQRAINEARPGSIILMHDIYPSTVDAVPTIIKGLRQRGFILVTVSQLLASTRPGQIYFSR